MVIRVYISISYLLTIEVYNIMIFFKTNSLLGLLFIQHIEEFVKKLWDIPTSHPSYCHHTLNRDACIEKLAEYGISHYYNHLPLDDCDFGTNDSVLNKLDLEMRIPNKGFRSFFIQ